ncbi:protein arginine N-methyltransferase 6 [Elysia marginata]|uniref:Protein arginine N-methyltransferase 6 n=1 Tax=Elysia marginata TaxID=1093978 RepID=A0AAV4FCG1_9GAST|nr:protein arginine N-methyltransferase 6 [Elysia marginata]
MASGINREDKKRKLDHLKKVEICRKSLPNYRRDAETKSREFEDDSSNVTPTNNFCREINHQRKEARLDQNRDIASNDEGYFRCYDDIRIHEQMLSDKVRTLAYRRALLENKSRLKGTTVLDVGAGTGILSHFAVQAGASQVFAVEPTRIACFARQICTENGTEESISVIQSKIEGYSLLYESMLPSVLWARDRYLKTLEQTAYISMQSLFWPIPVVCVI